MMPFNTIVFALVFCFSIFINLMIPASESMPRKSTKTAFRLGIYAGNGCRGEAPKQRRDFGVYVC